MVPILHYRTSIIPSLLTASVPRHSHLYRFQIPLRRPIPSVASIISNTTNSNGFDQYKQKEHRQNQQPPQPRTLYPGGYKRPEIKIPSLVLQLDPDEVLSGGNALGLVDKAVSKWVGIVVLTSNDATGGRLYEAACLLKSVIKDRAYLLVAERVDIAAAAGATGVLLSDQGTYSNSYYYIINRFCISWFSANTIIYNWLSWDRPPN